MFLGPEWPFTLGLAFCMVMVLVAPALLLNTTGILRKRKYEKVVDHSEPTPNEATPQYKSSTGTIAYRAAIISVLGSAVLLTPTIALILHYRTPDTVCGKEFVRLKKFDEGGAYEFSLVASQSQKSQDLFQAALLHMFAFDHIDALALFQSAWSEDQLRCSLCLWGQAYAVGPYLNRAIIEPDEELDYPVFSCSDRAEAHNLAVQANELSTVQGNPDYAQDLTRALVDRFEPAAPCSTATMRDTESRYASRLEALAYQYKEPSIAALAAEAHMNLLGIWNMTVSEGSSELHNSGKNALELLNYSLSLDPTHVFALHLKVHLLETMPIAPYNALPHCNRNKGSESGHSARDCEAASLAEAEQAADTLASLHTKYTLPGHFLHMPSHIFVRLGRWNDAMKMNKVAALQDQADSRHCVSPYDPEHNLDMVLLAGVLAGDYTNATWAANQLKNSMHLFRQTYVSPGTNVAALIEAPLYFGRCSEVVEVNRADARGRYSPDGDQYVSGLHTLKELLCLIQDHHRSGERQLASQPIASLLAELKSKTQQMPPDPITFPGPGLGAYSSGYKTMLQAYVALAEAAVATLDENWNSAANWLKTAVEFEHSMGHFEPARLFPLRPCLVSMLLLASRPREARDVNRADDAEFPGSWWSRVSQAAIQSALADDATSASHAKAACPIVFGDRASSGMPM